MQPTINVTLEASRHYLRVSFLDDVAIKETIPH
jgi:hypothetical protein